MFHLIRPAYDFNDFQDLSVKSFETHWGKHHAGYVKTLNSLIELQPNLQNLSLVQLIQLSYQHTDPVFQKIFNNAAQHFNHEFFWQSIVPNGVSLTCDLLQSKLLEAYPCLDALYTEFETSGLNIFGSGWVWIVFNLESQKIEVIGGEKAYTPVHCYYLVPLLTCDVWEHAYYIDYLNDRKRFLSIIWNNFNWSFAAKNYSNLL